ncbi:C1 family peptidase [Algibacter sp. L3A6]|uniref:C1 family peptidase n=1 Tax=Algibacter sp. L3A6 TaxID=2686366 RepID=UPI00131E7A6D|nr:C1 family peptidase [Algibacter sp. L3A6]
MSSPSINISINQQGKTLVEKIDNHFCQHEPTFYKNFMISSSIEFENGVNVLSKVKNGEFEISSDDDIKSWFDFELYSDIKNLVSLVNDSISSTIIVNIIVPLEEELSVSQLSKLLGALKELISNQQVDGLDIKIFAITYSLSEQNYDKDAQIKSELLVLEELISEYDYIISDIYYLDDRSSNRIVLNLNLNWLAFALGEFFVFQMVSQTSLAVMQNKSKIFGVGVIHFNEILFRSVIANKILQYKFEQEGVLDDEGVQLRDIINKCNPFINENQNFFQQFLENYPYSSDNNSDLTKNSKAYIDSFKKKLEDFVTDASATIGESKAILANLLGEDDNKIEGINWGTQRDNIDDLEFDIINYFNSYLEEKDKVDFDCQKELRNKISELSQAIKIDEKSIKAINDQSEEIHSDLDITFDEGIFSVNGDRVNASGYIPSVINPDDEFYVYSDEPISNSKDLTKYFPRVKDQGELGSCTAFTISAIYEFAAKLNNKHVSISEMFIYYNARELGGYVNEDVGSTLLETINAVKLKGACYSKSHPYSKELFFNRPSEAAYIEAQHQVVEKACRVKISEDDFKYAIANGHPVIIGLKLFKSFYPKNKAGIVPYPSATETAYEGHGNHALLVVGYNDDEKLFKLRNSWGDKFGESGYCYAPYDYIANSDFCLEAFVISNIVDLSYNEFTYDTDTSFSFLKDSILRKKTIKQYNLRLKKKLLNKTKEEYDLVALKNEENSERIKNPLFRKRLFEELKQEKAVITEVLIDPIIEKPKDKKGWFFIGGGFLLIILSIIMKPYIELTGSLVGSAIGVFLIFFGSKLFYAKTDIVTVKSNIDLPVDTRKIDLYTFEAADRLFSQFDEMNKNLIIRYKALSKYFSKVKKWQKESEDALNSIEYSSPTFVINVVRKKPLLDYLANEKHIFLHNLPNLSAVFHKNYIPSKDNTDEVFKELRDNYLVDINKNIENILDISIVDYIQGECVYPYFDLPPDLGQVMKSIEKISTPFCNIRQTTNSLELQNYVVHEEIMSASEDKLEVFSKHRGAAIKPVLSFRENKKKYVAIQVSALNSIKDLVRYNL